MKPAVLALIACCSLSANAQTPRPQPRQIATVAKEIAPVDSTQQLFAEEHWQEVVQSVESTPQRSAELNYYYGVALAHLGRFDDAHAALLLGGRSQPGDKRFPLELAGVAFRQKNYPQATAYLRRALRLDPQDAYANDFLATVYFLQGNNEAALKYWNRVEKPQIENLRSEPAPRTSSVLLDHAFAFSPASTLRLDDWVTTQRRLDGLEVFPSYRVDLEAHPDGRFDAVFHAVERNGLGNSKLEALLRFFRGVPYQEVHPEYFNIGGQTINFVSLVRWDAQKRRVWSELSGPLGEDPKWRYRLGADLRDENWALRNSFTGPAPLMAALNLRRAELSAGITRLVGPRLSWAAGAQLSRRDYRNVFSGTALTPQLLAKGYELKQSSQLNYELLRIPENRFTVTSGLGLQAGRIWSRPAQSFAKLQASLQARWFPAARDDDYETQWHIRAGKSFGQLPFDELFILGLERDNDLPLRAHIGTRDGRKGSAPLGGNYFLSNFETDKNVYSNGLFSFRLGPFLDTGRITGASAGLGSQRWLWDAGLQAKVSVLGVGVVLSYGRDLHSGHGAFYTSVAP
ncbi:MAG TPA: tetratricopeptide repeat protein [Terriglobales bacterium]|nr:tetratricopeptide repeat protein [Terriglobales bacterium]